jgi:hypothetical protein
VTLAQRLGDADVLIRPPQFLASGHRYIRNLRRKSDAPQPVETPATVSVAQKFN